MVLYLQTQNDFYMKNFIKLYLFVFLFLSDFVIYAQGEEDNNGDLEGNDPPNAPINSKLVLLLIFGIALAYYSYRKNKKIA